MGTSPRDYFWRGHWSRKKDFLYSVKNELNIDNETDILPQSDLNDVNSENFPTIEEQTEKIEKIKKQRESFGSVNLRADEETKKYETEIKESYESHRNSLHPTPRKTFFA